MNDSFDTDSPENRRKMETFDWKCPSLNPDGSVCGFYILAYTEEGLATRKEMHFHASHAPKLLPGKLYDPNELILTERDRALLRIARISVD